LLSNCGREYQQSKDFLVQLGFGWPGDYLPAVSAKQKKLSETI
jgi:hypothetical protein